MQVFVLDKNNKPLMPCSSARARELLRQGRAIKRWSKGVFGIKLLDRVGGGTQEIAVGVDPGSKREGFTVKSQAHTIMNVQAEAVAHVKKKIETRRMMRRDRWQRKTPYRPMRKNRGCLRAAGRLPPSTRARWQFKLRILSWLAKMFPIRIVVVEDMQARTMKNGRRWNLGFSSIQCGKNWFYAEIEMRWRLVTRQGYETYAERERLGLKKSSNKLAETFSAHCVDSWVLANMEVGGHDKPEMNDLWLVRSLNTIRRQLHKLQPVKGNTRQNVSGVLPGLRRLAIVRHISRGIYLVGGFTKNYFALNSTQTGMQVIKSARKSDLVFLAYNSFAVRAVR